MQNQAVNRSGEVERFEMETLLSPPGYGSRYAVQVFSEMFGLGFSSF